MTMTDFTKQKISFALALLGTLFALHPFVEKYADVGFDYEGYYLKVFYAFALSAGLLAFTVYCYAIALVSERVHGMMERMGNYAYAIAVMVGPLYGGLFIAHWLSDIFEASHLAWAAPGVALGVGVGWLVVSQVLAWLFHGRLSEEDRIAKIRQWADQEIAALNRAREMFDNQHYDLAVIEAWRAIEARLRRVLLAKGITTGSESPQQMIDAAVRAKVVHEPSVGLLQELRKQWNIAVSFDPLSRQAAEAALHAARNILATISLSESPKEAGHGV
jgi:HEPN domain-containing protein